MNSIKEILHNNGDGMENAMKPSVAITSISHTQPSPSQKIDILLNNVKPKEDQHPLSEAVVLTTKSVPSGTAAREDGNEEIVILHSKKTTKSPRRNKHKVSASFSMYSGTSTPEKPQLSVLLAAKSKSLRQDEDGSISILERAFNSLLRSQHKQTSASQRQEEASVDMPSGADIIVSMNTPSQTTNNAEDVLENLVELAAKEEQKLEQALKEEQKKDATTPPPTVSASLLALHMKASKHPAENEKETPGERRKLEAIVNFLHSFVPKLAAQLHNSPKISKK